MSIEWYNDNEGRNYPINEGASGRSIDGVEIPDGIIADLALSVPQEYNDVYVSSVTVTPALVSISLASVVGGGLASATVPIAGVKHTPIPLTPAVNDVSGFVVFGRGIEDVTGFTVYKFNPGDSDIDLRAIRFVDSLPVTSVAKAGTSLSLQGIVKVVPGDNIAVRTEDNRIIFSLVEAVREDFVGPCDKAKTLTGCGVPPIRTISGVGPDSEGRIKIEVI